MLRDSGFGCKIDNCYTGAISYADEITLSCPSIGGLNRMLVWQTIGEANSRSL